MLCLCLFCFGAKFTNLQTCLLESHRMKWKKVMKKKKKKHGWRYEPNSTQRNKKKRVKLEFCPKYTECSLRKSSFFHNARCHTMRRANYEVTEQQQEQLFCRFILIFSELFSSAAFVSLLFRCCCYCCCFLFVPATFVLMLCGKMVIFRESLTTKCCWFPSFHLIRYHFCIEQMQIQLMTFVFRTIFCSFSFLLDFGF